MKIEIITVALALLVTSGSSGTANADWQYANWGMTPDQVIAVSKGQMRVCDTMCKDKSTKTSTAKAYGNYQAGEFVFEAYALFDNANNKLSRVSLKLDNPASGFLLLGSLKAKYGEPITQRAEVFQAHTWRTEKDEITLTNVGFGGQLSAAFLEYSPRSTDANKGL
jgi:hypothetical protein